MKKAEIHIFLVSLNLAIKAKDKGKILKLYDVLKTVDWDNVSDQLFTQYDKLIDQANPILFDN